MLFTKSDLGLYKYTFLEEVSNLTRATLYTSLDRLSSNRIELSQCILIAGFWRSGTTWLQESIHKITQSKTIFEPLHPKVPEYRKTVMPALLKHVKHEDVPMRTFMPFCDENLQDRPELYQFLLDCFHARVSGSWVRTLRSSAAESLAPKTVVKVVRGQLCLRPIQAALGVPILYIHRDPRAVIASIMRMKDGGIFGGLRHLSLEKLLLQGDDGRRGAFEQWQELIYKADREDLVFRIATLWSLTELYARESLQSLDKVYRARYEDLCWGRTESLIHFLKSLGHDFDFNSASDLLSPLASKMTRSERKQASIEERILSWKRELSQRDLEKINFVLQASGLDQDLPLCSKSGATRLD